MDSISPFKILIVKCIPVVLIYNNNYNITVNNLTKATSVVLRYLKKESLQ